ncbi:MAG: alpha-D-ribose 1-methylphosphonate 5-phosphate C-P-lyase PhnJ [Pseudomonadota bacterium]
MSNFGHAISSAAETETPQTGWGGEQAEMQSEHAPSRASEVSATVASTSPDYNYAYLNESTKRMIRRTLLKAIAIPGHQVPFASREMPMPYGWGTGAIQITASVIGPDDCFKCIDQGADDTTNAVSIKSFFAQMASVEITEETARATMIQTRHRVPEHPLTEGQVIVFQVPYPEPLRFLEPRETETRAMHAFAEYGLQYTSLYEDVAATGQVSATHGHPVIVDDRYIMSPSPIPSFDNPKLHESPALQLYGAGREARIYAIPPYTTVSSLEFADRPFEVQTWSRPCALCGHAGGYLDEIITDDQGNSILVCSDTHFCEQQRSAEARHAARP